MNDDEELLELAAKAAELYDPRYVSDTSWGTGISHGKRDDVYQIWNPLTDDGDALRLAVKLRLRHECCNSGIVYVWRGSELVWNEFALHENSDIERCAATRRAIVNTAAEIGRNMK